MAVLIYPEISRAFGATLLANSVPGAELWQRGDEDGIDASTQAPRYKVIANNGTFGTPLILLFLDDGAKGIPGLDPATWLSGYADAVGAVRPGGAVDATRLGQANAAAVAALPNYAIATYRQIFNGATWQLAFSDG